jgi:adenosylhomocysteine nucleosidase
VSRDHAQSTPFRVYRRERRVILTSPGFLVGFAAEAKIAGGMGWPVAIGGGSTNGAARAARHLIDQGATGIVSFGLAGGLDPALPAGTLIVANEVIANGRIWPTDGSLSAQMGGATGHRCLGLDRIVVSPTEKQRLGRETAAVAVDMESGAIAETANALGVPFAVLRAICDAADSMLPPAALVALNSEGRIAPTALAWSIVTHPGQIGALLALARDAATARQALRSRIAVMQRDARAH